MTKIKEIAIIVLILIATVAFVYFSVKFGMIG